MNIVTAGTAKAITIYARVIVAGDYVCQLWQESANNYLEETITGVVVDNKLQLTLPWQFLEKRWYYLRCFYNDTEVYRGKIFCTDAADASNYNMLEDFYTEPTKEATTYQPKADYYTAFYLYTEDGNILQTESEETLEIEY